MSLSIGDLESLCKISGAQPVKNIDDVMEISNVNSIIGFSTNEEINEAVKDEAKVKTIVTFINENIVKTSHFHILVHEKLLKEPLLGRSYISSAE